MWLHWRGYQLAEYNAACAQPTRPFSHVQEHEGPLAEPILRAAGSDISHWYAATSQCCPVYLRGCINQFSALEVAQQVSNVVDGMHLFTEPTMP